MRSRNPLPSCSSTPSTFPTPGGPGYIVPGVLDAEIVTFDFDMFLLWGPKGVKVSEYNNFQEFFFIGFYFLVGCPLL